MRPRPWSCTSSSAARSRAMPRSSSTSRTVRTPAWQSANVVRWRKFRRRSRASGAMTLYAQAGHRTYARWAARCSRGSEEMTRLVGSKPDAMGTSAQHLVEQDEGAEPFHLLRLNHAPVTDNDEESLLPAHRHVQPILEEQVAEFPPAPALVGGRQPVAPRERQED